MEEALAKIIRGKDADRIAKALLDQCDGSVKRLEQQIATIKVTGLGQTRRDSIKAAFDIGRAYRMHIAEECDSIAQPADVARHVMPIFEGKDQEELWVLALNTRQKIVGKQMIFRGAADESVVHSREILRYVINVKGATLFILVHNHPSGDPLPSEMDISTTTRVRQAGQIVGIKLVDHIVIGDGCFMSFREEHLAGL